MNRAARLERGDRAKALPLFRWPSREKGFRCALILISTFFNILKHESAGKYSPLFVNPFPGEKFRTLATYLFP